MEFFKYINSNIYKTIDNELINKINNIKNINNIESKIKEKEFEYETSINMINNYIENNNEKENLTKLLSLEILQKESQIIKLISQYCLQNINVNKVFLINTLELLIFMSNILQQRLKQPNINIDDNKQGIPRCSYKFCNFKENCVYNYQKKNTCCYQDHFVHNMVNHDLYVLINFIKSTFNEDIIKINKEILKSLNTLSYVINHMETELKNKCMYLDKSEWDLYHIYKNKN
jgi:hypothetical protein